MNDVNVGDYMFKSTFIYQGPGWQNSIILIFMILLLIRMIAHVGTK